MDRSKSASFEVSIDSSVLSELALGYLPESFFSLKASCNNFAMHKKVWNPQVTDKIVSKSQKSVSAAHTSKGLGTVEGSYHQLHLA